jgi:hypothetical protein
MATTTFSRLRDYVEPAHPSVIKLQNDLINIYTIIRDRYQRQIDEAFTNVAQKTGFVVTTTLPVVLTIGQKGARMEMGTENLRGTLFEDAMMEVLKPTIEEFAGSLAPGEYPLYLIWHDALKLKMRTDWLEPAHFRRHQVAAGLQQVQPGWGVREPAHWFDPYLELDVRDALVINAIDQVYPELRLLERVEAARTATISAATGAISSANRQTTRFFGPGIYEPAHFRRFLQELDPVVLEQLMTALQEYQRTR